MRHLSPSRKQVQMDPEEKVALYRAVPKNILEAFEIIVTLSEDSNLSDEFLSSAFNPIKYASLKLKLTDTQVVLLANFIDRSEDQQILLSELARHFGCRTTKMLQYANDIDALVAKHYLKCSYGHGRRSYRVPMPVIDALRANQRYRHAKEVVVDLNDFFDKYEKLVQEMRDDEVSNKEFEIRVQDYLDFIKDTDFVKQLKNYNLRGDNRLLFIHMAYLLVENHDNQVRFNDLDDIFENESLPAYIKIGLRNRKSELFTKGLIENVNEDGMVRADVFKLTDKAKEEFLGDLNPDSYGKSSQGLIQASSLAGKTLIYNSTEKDQVEQLAAILSEERFREVQDRLKKAGMRSGFCSLFYGAPGTGKTETVYQIARQTGRDILRVDVDKIKSCWVGESEKNIKTLFDRYRNMCRNAKVAPILLFNEADAVLGVRMEGASKAVDKMENSLQNIILQEMETLEGIMIATTNLTTNLDKAFERRFLYKIRFDKPTLEARVKIWRSIIPTLSEYDAKKLAKEFDLTGGEIENVSRRHTVNVILTGDETIDLEAFRTMCRQEKLAEKQAAKIGY